MVTWRSVKAAESIVDAAHGSTKHASGRIGHGRSERHYWTAPIVGRSAYAVGTCFVTCNGKTEITESVQIVLNPVFDVESDGMVRFWSGGDPH